MHSKDIFHKSLQDERVRRKFWSVSELFARFGYFVLDIDNAVCCPNFADRGCRWDMYEKIST